ncbi:MAG: hypothetical protein MSC30_15540 [Gaiellaceae bacterium MAG52_C11]|nr:hypothetical protein [Candidatus Gaiellasilicea maunaloa]
MRLLGALAIVVALVALAGCGEDAQQRAAREETQAYVTSLDDAERYEIAESHCTNSARTGWFVIVETNMFVCSVRLTTGGCDWFRVDSGTDGTSVRLAEPDAGCALPE